MKKLISLAPTLLSALGGLLLIASPAAAQAYKAEVDKPAFEALLSPDIRLAVNKNFRPKEWLEMEVEFELDARPLPVDGYIDRCTVQWYAAIKKRDGNGFWLLSKNVDHVNIKIGEKYFSSVYLSPSTYERLTGSERVNKGDIEAVGGIILVNGIQAGQFSSKNLGAAPWWQSPSLARTEKFTLLNKDESPFAPYWYDRYAEIAAERR